MWRRDLPLETAVTSNSQTFRELQSLREELSGARREQSSPGAPPPSVAQPPAGGAEPSANGSEGVAASPPKGATERDRLGEEIGDLMNELTEFFDEAEKNIVAHPAATAIGALVVGLIIGRLLQRR